MSLISIEKFVEGISSIPEKDFNVETIYQFLEQNPVETDSLEPYLHFSRRCYTRNLIYRNELFELMAICWDKGQVSRVHNHDEQNCWMSVPLGRLRVQNFNCLELDEASNFCRLEPANAVEIDTRRTDKVELEQPIHQVQNPLEFDSRAVSLHVYSRPIERCLVYSIPRNEFAKVQLCYTSMYGKICDGAQL